MAIYFVLYAHERLRLILILSTDLLCVADEQNQFQTAVYVLV